MSHTTLTDTVLEELAETKRHALLVRNDRESLMTAAKALLAALDREPWLGIADMDDKPDYPLRDAVRAIEKRLEDGA